MKYLLKKFYSDVRSLLLILLQKIERVFLSFIKFFGQTFEVLENLLELVLFWGALFPIKFTDIKNRHIIRGEIKRVEIDSSVTSLEVAKITIEKIHDEYNKRQNSSSDKMKILFQSLSLVFAVNAAILEHFLFHFL